MRRILSGINWKSILLTFWKMLVVALVNIMVFLMLASGSVEGVGF